MADGARAEMQLLDAMYPSALQLDPPGWQDDDRSELPVCGQISLEISEYVAAHAHFTLLHGYPDKDALVLDVSCPDADKSIGVALRECSNQSCTELADGCDTPLSDWLTSLRERIQDVSIVVARSEENESSKASDVVSYPEGPVKFAAPLPAGHSGLLEGQVDRQWITFISFTSSKIAKEFCAAALGNNITGFLMVGKPGIACLEGGPKAISAFLKIVRTDIFAQIDPAARKMTLSINEEACTRVRFDGFTVQEFSQYGKGSATDTGSTSCSMTNKKRTARADLLQLKEFLLSRGIVEGTFDRVTMHAQNDV
eukprot:TRINITY_DN16306_c0_g1_i1.p1 TRINITY_DN16306_c0_g1~~TRINITY_DN16306_c0_g1_i1.p1  ORF type:complete len:312 (-),score=31.39 TRINITY_DN16306_c0_g1_i1:11-946(-)